MLQGRPFVAMGVGWIAGILIATQTTVDARWWLVATVVCLLVGVGWIYYTGRGWAAVLLMIGLCMGAAHLMWTEARNYTDIPSGSVQGGETWRLEGIVVSPPEVDGDRGRWIVQVKQIEDTAGRTIDVDERLLVQKQFYQHEQKQATIKLKRGQILRFSARLQSPEPARNPGAFDYRTYLYHRGIHWIAEVDAMEVVDDSTSWRSGVDSLRSFLGERLEVIYPETTAGMIRGMLLGERKEVPPQVEEDFALLGLIHLLAISGLHVGIFVGCLFGGLQWSGMRRERAAAVTMLAIPIYVLLTGAGVPVVRAGMMGILALLALMLRRFSDSLSFLAVALVAMLIWNPYALFEVGFQLSFTVTAALLIAVRPLAHVFPFPWPRFNQLLAVTLTAQWASLPLILHHFREISLLSGLLNLAVVPVVSIAVIPVAFLALLLSLVHEGLAWLPALFSSWVLEQVVAVVHHIAAWNVGRLIVSPPSWGWIAAYAVTGAGLLMGFTGGPLLRRRLLPGALVMSLVLAWWAWLPAGWANAELRITFLDVGQGDCVVIETPANRVLVVDGGGNLPFFQEEWQQPRRDYEVGRDVVVRYLQYRGIRRIDEMVLSHGDADHIGGLRAVARRYPVERVIRNHHPPQSDMEAELMELLYARGAEVLVPQTGAEWELEPGIRWQFLHPGETLGTEPNNDSVVFLLTAFQQRILLTGDIEEEAERQLLRQWDLPPLDLMKVAHHGSRTSTAEEWLEQTRPQMAVISAGRNNRYGHPSPEVVERLGNHGVQLWRTDRDGAVTFILDETGWRVETMVEYE
ncbi:DNA internalization-related competence protein ComEC/Rec2 [Desmospora activa]|uniref:Competence protein ComEC n=1 Tax=Desmospora activa DSM 45169 TaxID=1121389 RepID=A0A2T4ZCC7_9BACL|nr:DNA internalization-related competence protein ComEC/Rec2 [Desmospora activa]PTM59535.1 competence protein ComEC [Desmospora activa DSM 45169]